MTDDSSIHRRRVLSTVGIGATVVLAGCSSSDDADVDNADTSSPDADVDNADTSGPEAVVRTYYQRLSGVAQDMTSADEAVRVVSPIIYEESMFLRRDIRESFNRGRVEAITNLASVETVVTAEDLSRERLNGLGFGEVFSEKEIATIAQENANVEATLNYTGDMEPITEDLHITGKINDEWVVIAAGN